MIKAVTPGQILFALGCAGLGILSLIYRDFALQWQPVPAWIAHRATLARGSGVLAARARLPVASAQTTPGVPSP